MSRNHYSYTTYADPETARTFDARRFGGPIGDRYGRRLVIWVLASICEAPEQSFID